MVESGLGEVNVGQLGLGQGAETQVAAAGQHALPPAAGEVLAPQAGRPQVDAGQDQLAGAGPAAAQPVPVGVAVRTPQRPVRQRPWPRVRRDPRKLETERLPVRQLAADPVPRVAGRPDVRDGRAMRPGGQAGDLAGAGRDELRELRQRGLQPPETAEVALCALAVAGHGRVEGDIRRQALDVGGELPRGQDRGRLGAAELQVPGMKGGTEEVAAVGADQVEALRPAPAAVRRHPPPGPGEQHPPVGRVAGRAALARPQVRREAGSSASERGIPGISAAGLPGTRPGRLGGRSRPRRRGPAPPPRAARHARPAPRYRSRSAAGCCGRGRPRR